MRTKVILVATVLLLVSLLAVSCASGVPQEEYDRVSQELEITKTMLSEVQAQFQATQLELAETKAELEELQKQFDLYKELGISVYSDVQPNYSSEGVLSRMGISTQVHLSNNPAAINPTWQELKAFLLVDGTDEKMYLPGYMCADFAEEVHNNAEAAGIRAAWVAVHFEDGSEGHALNTFVTTDKGLVYVDCTGSDLFDNYFGKIEPVRFEDLISGRNISHKTKVERDKVAYVTKSREYGSISLGANTPLEYVGYERMVLAWDSYNQRVEDFNRRMESHNREVEQYNKEIEGKVFYIGTPEWQRVNDWYNRLQVESGQFDSESEVLDKDRTQLEILWEPLGIVSSIEIYW